MFVVFPDEVIRQYTQVVARERFEGADQLGLWVLFNAVPDPRPGSEQFESMADMTVVIPLRGRYRDNFMAKADISGIPRPTSTPVPTRTPDPRAAAC